ncbi:hypothetical protein D3C87_587630 [compost metagenome]
MKKSDQGCFADKSELHDRSGDSNEDERQARILDELAMRSMQSIISCEPKKATFSEI